MIWILIRLKILPGGRMKNCILLFNFLLLHKVFKFCSQVLVVSGFVSWNKSFFITRLLKYFLISSFYIFINFFCYLQLFNLLGISLGSCPKLRILYCVMVNCAGSEGRRLGFEFPLYPFTVLSFKFLKCKMAIIIVSTNRIMC